MSLGLIGIKQGMSQIFHESGAMIPVTIISVEPNYVTQVKTVETDAYQAIQVGTGSIQRKKVTNALAGHFSKANVPLCRTVSEFRSDAAGNPADMTVGAEIPITIFNVGQRVDVSGTTKGCGFTGVIKRWNFRSQKDSHGNSLSHRAPGSIGQNQSPGKVFKGKKMAGRHGNTAMTMQNLEIVQIDSENNLILIKGAVPGPSGRYVRICPAVKTSRATDGKGDK